MTAPRPQPRRYRIRVYDRDREVLTLRQYMAVLDFTSGPQLRATEGQLDGLLQSLAYADGARGEKVLGYHLDVEEWEPPHDRVCCWPAKTWPEPRY